VTEAFPLRVNVQVFVLFPPLEQAPDQITSRSFVARSVIDVPVLNGAEPVVPTSTLIPAGVDVIRSPLRPVAVTVSVAVCAAGVTVRVAVRVTPAALAVIVTGVDVVTALVGIAKVALVAPCATDTLAGTVAAVLLSDSATVNPPAGAADVSVTVPCEEAPPVTLVGLTETAESAAAADGVTVRVAVRVMPPAFAVIVTGVDVVTALVGIAKVALVAPCATDTLAGTVAAVLLSDSATVNPPAGAAAVSVTVPCEDAPPVTLVGLTETAESAAGAADGVTVRTAVRETPLAEAVIVVVRVVGPARVEIGKVPLLRWRVTVAGTVAAAVFELESETTKPPEGGPDERKMVPVAPLPPSTVAGDTDRDVGVTGGGGGVTVRIALRVAPPKVPVMVPDICSVTDAVLTVKVPLVAPAATVTLPGTVAVLGMLLDSVTTAPPEGAAVVKVAVPVEALPPTTLVGFTDTDDKLAAAACAVKRRAEENGPNTPAELRPRTRHHSCWAGRPPMVTCETLTVWLKVSGVVKLLELSIWMM
jgi:hypothetical protein